MDSNNRNGSSAARARGFMAFFAALAMGPALASLPAEAAPFAYVTDLNAGQAVVLVIDTATNTVMTTVPSGVTNTIFPIELAVAPDGKHVYVLPGREVSVIDAATNTVVARIPVEEATFGLAVTPDSKRVYVVQQESGTVVVIDAASNTVVDKIKVGDIAEQVAIAPDGTHAYVTNFRSNTVSVIETASNTVVATVPAGNGPFGVAVTPDGKHVYVANVNSVTVSVIATATNTGVARVTVGGFPREIAITPDGKHAYVATADNVSVIETSGNTVAAAVPDGNFPTGVAVTPDGKNVYVANTNSANVSVIATASNTVVATIPARTQPTGVAIVLPPPGIPFLAFNAKLQIQFGSVPNHDAFGFGSSFTLSSTDSNGIDPPAEAVTLQAGTFAATLPPGSFTKRPDGSFTFTGVVNGVGMGALIKPTGTLRYAFQAKAQGANLAGTENAVYATLTIGDDSGATSVNAAISP